MIRPKRQIYLSSISAEQAASSYYQNRMCDRKNKLDKKEAMNRSKALNCWFYKCLFCEDYHLTTKGEI